MRRSNEGSFVATLPALRRTSHAALASLFLAACTPASTRPPITPIPESLHAVINATPATVTREAKARNLQIAIVAVPGESAQAVTEKLVAAGIKAILNFAPGRIKAGKDVRLKNVDLAIGSVDLQSSRFDWPPEKRFHGGSSRSAALVIDWTRFRRRRADRSIVPYEGKDSTLGQDRTWVQG